MANLRISQFILACFLMAGTVVLSPTTGRADDTQELRNQVQSLQQKVDELQKQLVDQTVQPTVQPAGVDMYYQWDPFEQVRKMDRQMNQIMKDNMVVFNPREDVRETSDAYIINMDIPGMEKDKINVEVKNGMLIVSGDRNNEVKENKSNQFYLQERSFGHFLRTMSLPDDAKMDGIEAHYNNGVLTVKIPRNKASNPKGGAQKINVK